MDDASFENIAIERQDEGAILLLRFQRPAALNALDKQTLEELDTAIEYLERHEGPRALILTGAGEKAFVAGADISRFPEMDAESAEEFSAMGSSLFSRIEELPLIVIAAVNGFALGGGCELAMACDFIYADPRARFGQPEVKLGIIAGFGGTQRLYRRVGYGQAMELLSTGGMIDAEEALRIGLVNRISAPGKVVDEALETARTIVERAPRAVAASKHLVQVAANSVLADGLSSETRAFGDLFRTRDASEGVQAFLEKRKPSFTGE